MMQSVHFATAALTDPVCGMAVTEQSAHHHLHAGKLYYFCCAGCKQAFDRQPEKYTLSMSS